MSTSVSAPSVRKKSFARSSKPSSRMCVREQRSLTTMSSSEVYWPVPMRAIGAQNLLTMPGGVTASGYLHKKGGSQFSLMKWPLRYIIIHKGCLYYFKSSTSPAPQGAFSLNGYNRVMRAAEETTSSNVFPFKVVHFSKKHRTWFFSAASEDERMKWMRFLRKEISHYNDRSEAQVPSDSDSDSFYGTIETPMELKHPVDSTEDDYAEEEDEDEDEEDYMKPDNDGSPTSTGRPTGPPPAYPPPPVPSHLGQSFSKAPPPPLPPPHRPTKKTPPTFPPPTLPKDFLKAPPSPLPFAHAPSPSPSPSPSAPPTLPPPNLKRSPPGRPPAPLGPGAEPRDGRTVPAVSVLGPLLAPVCQQLESSLVLNGAPRCPSSPGGNYRHQLVLDLHSKQLSPAHLRPPPSRDLLTLAAPPPQLPPSPRLPAANKPGAPRPPPTVAKPRPFQRTSPEGQSFRSHAVSEAWRRAEPPRGSSEGHASDEDYENMQLPDTVYIDTTETCVVEKMFRVHLIEPSDGLYAIRNSGTKTSKVLVVWDASISKARNYRLFREEHSIYLDSEMPFPDLAELIQHYHNHPLPHHHSLCLQMPYTHPHTT